MTDLLDLPLLLPLPSSPIPSEPVSLANDFPERHPKFYFNFVTFLVEDRLFMLPKHLFTQSSRFFAAFLRPVVDEQMPVMLEGVEKVDFQALLKLMYPIDPTYPKPALSTEEWESVLKLATRWFMLDLRTVAIDALSGLPPVDKISLARQYGVFDWLRDGYTHLASRAETLSVAEATAIGLEATLKLVAVREELCQRNREEYFRNRGQLAQSPSSPPSSVVDVEFADELQQIRVESRSSPVERIIIAKQHKVAEWLRAAYCELIERREALSLAEATLLGVETSIALCRARERSLRSYVNRDPWGNERHGVLRYGTPHGDYRPLVDKSFDEELKGVRVAGKQYSHLRKKKKKK